MAALAAEKGLQLAVEPLRTPNVRVVGDAYRLHQVLLNLLSNAIKFTEQGSIRLGAEVIEDTPHQLLLRFWVQDTGTGIAPEEQLHIFDAFAQASHETSLRFGGTGLGLSITRMIVERHGGSIVCESGEGQGSTFTMTLPAEGPPPAF